MTSGREGARNGPPLDATPSHVDSVAAELLDATRDGLALFDANAAFVFCNARYRELNPAIEDLLVASFAWEILLRQALQRSAIREEDASRLGWMEMRLAEGAGSVPPLDLVTGSGDIHEISMRPTSAGGFIVVQRDVTGARRYARGDSEADVLLRKVLEACPANVVMSRIDDGQILYRSPAATELLGASRCYYDHFSSVEERADFITALLPDGRVDNVQVAGLNADGVRFPCSISARVIDYRGEDVMVSNTVDMTRELALQRTLADQREQIFQAEKMSALGELLAGVAHELNNPLSVVVGHALMLRDEVTDAALLRRIEKISSSAERCGRIVKSFLAMARQQPARLSSVDLRETVAGAIDALRQGEAGLSSAVEVEVPAALPRMHADPHQVTQVFINLISNADQAIRDSGIGGRICISGRYDAASEMIEIQVADNGPGIPRDIQNRIFDPLFTTKDVGKGTGIGLAFCHRVVTSHKGQIRLDSGRISGASFIIRMPATARDQSRTIQTHTSDGRLDAERVLVIEDEQDVADLIREILQREGLSVDHVGSAEAALTALHERRYALILTDLNMPGLGGRGFYQRVLSDHPELVRTIGFVTGDAMSPSARAFLDGAGRPCLEKPLSPRELRRLARTILDGARRGVAP